MLAGNIKYTNYANCKIFVNYEHNSFIRAFSNKMYDYVLQQTTNSVT